MAPTRRGTASKAVATSGTAKKRASTAIRSVSTPKRVVVGNLAVATQPADDPLAPLRVSYLVDAVGGAAQLARIIGVNRSQPSRWISGEERPGGRSAPLIIDLEHVVSRARLVWGDPAATTWLESTNSYLGGARPLDVLLSEGPGRVLDALDAVTAGSFS